METISNIASSAATTASKLIYGEQTKTEQTKTEQTKTENNETAGKEPLSGEQGKGTPNEPFDQGNAATPLETAERKTFLDYSNNDYLSKDSPNNETAGKEPISGQQGKGTVTEPFDQGNDVKATSAASTSKDDYLKLNPTLDGPTTHTKTESEGHPKIYTNREDATYTGMPIVPLNPDVATSGLGTKSSSATESTGITDKAGVTDKVWRDTALDDISRSGAPGAGPSAPGHVTSSTETYQGSATPNKEPQAHEVDAIRDSKTQAEMAQAGTTENRDTPSWASTGTAADGGNFEDRLVGEKPNRMSESGKSPISPTSPTGSEEKSGKMSHLSQKLKDKLHIGSKDK